MEQLDALPSSSTLPSKLPPLRQDITLLPGPKGVDGLSTWTLHDPLTNQFYRIGWMEFVALSEWSEIAPSTLITLIKKNHSIDIREEYIGELYHFLNHHHLLRQHDIHDTANTTVTPTQKKGLNTMLHKWMGYCISFRIPLLHPASLLDTLYPLIRFLYARPVLIGFACAFVIGLVNLHGYKDELKHTFSYFFNIQGMIIFGLMLFTVQLLHELGHALTCRHFNVKVPVMGITFIVLFPLPYTDTTDAWRLSERYKRLAIGCGGMAVELMLATIAMYVWMISGPGIIKSMAFFMVTVTMISTILINLNPLMRFDGYYILSDLLGIENLQTRSMTLSRWWMRKTFLGIQLPPPEELPNRLQKFCIFYGIAAMVYRLILYISIALVVYHKFFKLLGVTLIIFQIGSSIVKPIIHEIQTLRKMKEHLRWNRQAVASLSIVVICVAVVVFPWKRHIAAPAYQHAANEYKLYPITDAKLISVDVDHEGTVQKDTVLMTLASPSRYQELREAKLEAKQAAYQLDHQVHYEPWSNSAREYKAALESTRLHINQLQETANRLIVKSPITGIVTDINPDLKPGQWVSSTTHLATVIDPSKSIIDAYVSEEDLKHFTKDSNVSFVSHSNFKHIPCRILDIETVSTSKLSIPMMSSNHGGDIAVHVNKHGELIPEEALYHVTLLPLSPSHTTQYNVGRIIIEGDRSIPIVRGFAAITRILKQEFGV